MENLVQRCIDGAPGEADTECLVAGSVSDRWLKDRSEALSVHHDSFPKSYFDLV